MENIKKLIESGADIESMVEAMTSGRVPYDNEIILFEEDYEGFKQGEKAMASNVEFEQGSIVDYKMDVESMDRDLKKRLAFKRDDAYQVYSFAYNR